MGRVLPLPHAGDEPPEPRSTGRDLSGQNLAGAEMAGADLRGARLVGADLRGAILVGADLTEAELLGARLDGARLDGCTALRAGFGGCRFDGASLFEADLSDACLSGASFVGADLRAARLDGTRLVGADLRRADGRRASLREAHLEDARLDGACFDGADLRHATVRGMRGYETARFVRADLRDVDFAGAYRFRRFAHDQNYLEEFRGRDRLHALLYWIWWVTSDCGRSLGRWTAWVVVVTLLFGVAFQATAVDYGAHETWLSPYYFSAVTLTTLGYGDVRPASEAAQVVAMVEVVVGYVMLGGLLSIFANKMARRAD